MAPIRHHSITVDGLNIFVREAGDPAAPTIVLLPGYPSSTRAYVRLIDRLAARWHAVAIDYPGFGGSDPLPQSPTFAQPGPARHLFDGQISGFQQLTDVVDAGCL